MSKTRARCHKIGTTREKKDFLEMENKLLK